VASLRIRHEQLIRLDFHQLDCSLVGCPYVPHYRLQDNGLATSYRNLRASLEHPPDYGLLLFRNASTLSKTPRRKRVLSRSPLPVIPGRRRNGMVADRSKRRSCGRPEHLICQRAFAWVFPTPYPNAPPV